MSAIQAQITNPSLFDLHRYRKSLFPPKTSHKYAQKKQSLQAGLTQGASTGAGLGNAFLSHVRAVDGIFQVVRAFDDAEVIHVEGDVNPIRDMEIIQTELRLKDTEWVQKKLEALKKTFRGTGTASLADKAKKEEIARSFFFLNFGN